MVAAAGQIRSSGRLRDLILGARLDTNLFHLLVNKDTQNSLRQVLIETYFDPALWPALLDVAQVAMQSADYETRLQRFVREPFALQEAPETGVEYRAEARSAAFRRTVVTGYDATCAMCGVRLKTPEGRTAVAAAHIVPWTVSHNDDPCNGVALCGLHHWTFDQGLSAITSDLRGRVSTLVSDDEGTQLLRSLSGRGINRPTEAILQPAPEALAWHLEHVFRR
ncbi:MAG: HNH endonuclease [Chloroflexota bacterium]|nr:HNH endonuclease [Chloroflexota bacterium]